MEQSRRDDLEGAGYVLLYLLMGELPWMGLQAQSKEEKYSMIRDMKYRMHPDILVKGYPKEFSDYLSYTRNLGFTEDPDYNYVRRIFKELYVRCNFENEFIFDWTIQKYNPQLNQTGFMADLGLFHQRMSNQSDGISDQNMEGLSMDNRPPVSNDNEVVDVLSNPELADLVPPEYQ